MSSKFKDMDYKQIAEKLYKDTRDPYMRSVYSSFIEMDIDKPLLQEEVLMDLIRSYSVIIRQNIMFLNVMKKQSAGYINMYNKLFRLDKNLVLVYYIPHTFNKDYGDDIFYNELICYYPSENLFYLCNEHFEPLDKGYKTIEEIQDIHDKNRNWKLEGYEMD